MNKSKIIKKLEKKLHPCQYCEDGCTAELNFDDPKECKRLKSFLKFNTWLHEELDKKLEV